MLVSCSLLQANKRSAWNRTRACHRLGPRAIGTRTIQGRWPPRTSKARQRESTFADSSATTILLASILLNRYRLATVPRTANLPNRSPPYSERSKYIHVRLTTTPWSSPTILHWLKSREPQEHSVGTNDTFQAHSRLVAMLRPLPVVNLRHFGQLQANKVASRRGTHHSREPSLQTRGARSPSRLTRSAAWQETASRHPGRLLWLGLEEALVLSSSFERTTPAVTAPATTPSATITSRALRRTFPEPRARGSLRDVFCASWPSRCFSSSSWWLDATVLPRLDEATTRGRGLIDLMCTRKYV
jgi:hypothetical protein